MPLVCFSPDNQKPPQNLDKFPICYYVGVEKIVDFLIEARTKTYASGGDLNKSHGTETITKDGKVVYTLTYQATKL